jgi:hypothetical protein
MTWTVTVERAHSKSVAQLPCASLPGGYIQIMERGAREKRDRAGRKKREAGDATSRIKCLTLRFKHTDNNQKCSNRKILNLFTLVNNDHQVSLATIARS